MINEESSSDTLLERRERALRAMQFESRDPRTAPYLELGTVREPQWSAVMDPSFEYVLPRKYIEHSLEPRLRPAHVPLERRCAGMASTRCKSKKVLDIFVW